MKTILTRRAPLTRQLPIPTKNTITNRTLRLPLQRRTDILPPSHQPLNKRIAIPGSPRRRGKIHHALSVGEPGVPFFFDYADAVDGFYFCAVERVGGGEADGDGHCLFVDGDGSGDFAR